MGRPLIGYAVMLTASNVPADVFPEGLVSPRERWIGPQCPPLSVPADVARQLAAEGG